MNVLFATLPIHAQEKTWNCLESGILWSNPHILLFSIIAISCHFQVSLCKSPYVIICSILLPFAGQIQVAGASKACATTGIALRLYHLSIKSCSMLPVCWIQFAICLYMSRLVNTWSIPQYFHKVFEF